MTEFNLEMLEIVAFLVSNRNDRLHKQETLPLLVFRGDSTTMKM